MGGVKINSTLAKKITTLHALVQTLLIPETEKQTILEVCEEEALDLATLLELRESVFKRIPFKIPKSSKDLLWATLLNLQHQQDEEQNFVEWDNAKVCEWVRQHKDWGVYVEEFRKCGIIGLSLVLLTEDDLERYLQVRQIGIRAEMMNELNELRLTRSNALDSLSKKAVQRAKEHEFICVPLHQWEHEFTLGTSWMDLRQQAKVDRISPVIAFAGPTACGKSRLLATLLSFSDRIEQRLPVIAKEGQTKSTTGNVALFFGSLPLQQKSKEDEELSERSLLLLDLEGENGTVPRTLKGEVKEFLKHKTRMVYGGEKQDNGGEPALRAAVTKRMAWIKQELPKLAYLLVNVMVYVDRQPMHNANYLNRLMDFSKRAMPVSHIADQPHLVIVQNFCTDNDVKEYDISASTVAFLALLQRFEATETLEVNFTSITFIKIPDANKYPDLFADQVARFHAVLVGKTHASSNFRLNRQNGLSEDNWFVLVEDVLKRFREKDPKINMGELFFRVCKPSNAILSRICDFFTSVYTTLTDSPEVLESYWSVSKFPAFVEYRLKTFEKCFVTTLLKLVELLIPTGAESEGWSLEKDVQKFLLGNFESCYAYLLNRAPCAHSTKASFCTLEKATHHQRHRLHTPYLRKPPQWTRKRNTGFQLQPLNMDYIFGLYMRYAEELMRVAGDPSALVQLKHITTQKLFSLDPPPPDSIREKIEKLRSPFCMVCLQTQPMVLFACEHAVCRSCYVKICPLCSSDEEVFDPSLNTPSLARPRVLSLDGGGVRFPVQLKILRKIVKLTHLQIWALFDLIVGTNTGALLAATFALDNPPESLAQTCEQLASKLFPTSKATVNVPFDELATFFGDKKLKYYADKKLAQIVIVATDDVLNTRVLFSSFASPQTIWDTELSLAVGASIANHPLKPVSYKDQKISDGRKVAANPADIALELARQTWGASPGVLLSIGTGEKENGKEPEKGAHHAVVRGAKTVAQVDEQLHNYATYHRINGPHLEGLGMCDMFSPEDYKRMKDKTRQWLHDEKKQIKQLCLILLAQVLFIEPGPPGPSNEVRFKIRSRVPGHFSGPAQKVTCKGPFRCKLSVRVTSEDKKVCLSGVPQPNEGDGWDVVLQGQEGEYTLKVKLLWKKKYKANIGGSPCRLCIMTGTDGQLTQTMYRLDKEKTKRKEK